MFYAVIIICSTWFPSAPCTEFRDVHGPYQKIEDCRERAAIMRDKAAGLWPLIGPPGPFKVTRHCQKTGSAA